MRSKGPRCYVCNKLLTDSYIFAYIKNGRVLKTPLKICDIYCERKLDDKRQEPREETEVLRVL